MLNNLFAGSNYIYTETQKLTASDLVQNDRFGQSVAISANGNTILIGAPYEDTSPQLDNGAAYIFTRAGSTWEQQKILANDRATSDAFGWSVAISADSNTLLIGTPFADIFSNTNAGAAYVYIRSGLSWNLQEKLTASDALGGAYFGSSVGLSDDGNTAIVGALYQESPPLRQNGAAYVFTRSNGSWSQQQKLTASDAGDYDRLGESVAISADGNTVILGTKWDDTNFVPDIGAAYIFIRSGGSWNEQQKLIADDSSSLDYFGVSVAISADGNTAVIGADFQGASADAGPGAAYVFTRSGGSWSQQQKLTASNGENGDRFGISVAISADGNTVIVGAYLDDRALTNIGSAYIFTRFGSNWSEQQNLIASDAAMSDYFGNSVAISADGNTVIVGAYFEDSLPPPTTGNNGAAYIFSL